MGGETSVSEDAPQLSYWEFHRNVRGEVRNRGELLVVANGMVIDIHTYSQDLEDLEEIPSTSLGTPLQDLEWEKQQADAQRGSGLNTSELEVSLRRLSKDGLFELLVAQFDTSERLGSGAWFLLERLRSDLRRYGSLDPNYFFPEP